MAVYTQETAKANVRVRDGRRVFYLDERDHLTSSARQWLERDGVEILPASKAKPTEYTTLFGAKLTEKPEHMTHLRPTVLVPKDHPRIAFRGMVDALEAELLLCARAAGQGQLQRQLCEILEFVRSLIRCDVMEKAVEFRTLCGLTPDQIRQHSHMPQRYYDQPHFMPSAADSDLLLQLNRLRTLVRQTELAAYKAFRTADGDVTRPDLITALNRLSSLIWILMIRRKKEENSHGIQS
jgi:ethanolamine utilization cobalamin adenosyltransferase